MTRAVADTLDASALLANAGPTMSVLEAAQVLGISRNTAYAEIKAGNFPARTIRVGLKHRIVTASLRAALGLDSQE